MQYGWDHPETACAYEAFCREHTRYLIANQALVSAAALAPGQKILDLAAGTGRTAALVLEALEGQCELVCLEPAEGMRAVGQPRAPQARWISAWPQRESFDRILCGAAIWQFRPLEELFGRAAMALRQPGAFVFNIPMQYLCEADEPGGGEDPWLTQMIGHLAEGRGAEYRDAAVAREQEIEGLLNHAGFRPVGWGVRGRLTQAEYRDWLKIPVLTNGLLGPWSAAERAARIDAAFAKSDAASWRWEAWRGWSAWK